MHQPLWKRLLSYLTTVEIEQTSSLHNPILRLFLSKGRYQLQTPNAIYSYDDLYDNFTKAFQLLDFQKVKIENVLILGFGLGSIPVLLEKHFQKKYHYTAVEIDAEVLRLANQYVVPNIASPIEQICNDAYNFAAETDRKFDLICMDVFLDDIVPTALEADDFLHFLERMLNENGVLLFNKLAFLNKDKQIAKNFYRRQFKRIFTEGGYLDVDGNYILVNKADFFHKTPALHI